MEGDSIMTDLTSQDEQLIADLLTEAHALRMKYEEFSKYTESKVAEFVEARRTLTAERDQMAHRLGLAEQDLLVLRQRQEQLHRQLIDVATRLAATEARLATRTAQRDRARTLVRAYERSRAVRLAKWLRTPLRARQQRREKLTK